MGIPEFWGQHVRNVEDVNINKLPSNDVYSLALDLPGIIHAAAQKTWIYGNHGLNNKEVQDARAELKKAGEEVVRGRFYHAVTNKIQELVAIYDPKLLIIALDGRAPLSKVQEQRKRRYKSRQLSGSEIANFDPVEISVGTDLMIGLHKHISVWISNSQMPYEKSYINKEGTPKTCERTILPAHVIYSSYLIPGEAEHKIMEIFKSGNFYELSPGMKSGVKYCNILYGKDADLILLSLLSPLEDIVVVRESLTNMVNIEGLKTFLNGKNIPYLDYVIMLSLVGNDFMPRQPAFRELKHGVDRLIVMYQSARLHYNTVYNRLEDTDSMFADDEGIAWDRFYFFLEMVSSTDELYKDMVSGHLENKTYNRAYQSDVVENSITRVDNAYAFKYSKFKKLWYDKALKYREEIPFNITADEEDEEEEIKFLLEGGYDKDDIDTMCHYYLIMFVWVYRYYVIGDADWNIYYPYHYAPLLEDIVNYIKPKNYDDEEYEEHVAKLNSTTSNVSAVSESESKKGDYHILQQLLCITPPSSKDILPEKLKRYMDIDSGIIDMYPSMVEIDVDGSKSEATYNCLVSFADMTRVMKITNKVVRKISGTDWEEKEKALLFKSKHQCNVDRNMQFYNAVRVGGIKTDTSSSGRGRGYRGSSESSGRGRGYRGSSGSSESSGRGRGYRGSSGSSESSESSEGSESSARGRGYRGRARGRGFRGRSSGRGSEKTGGRSKEEEKEREE